MEDRMGQSIRDVMTPDPIVCPSSATVSEAARLMRERDIGDVLVERDGAVCGVLTDRDIAVRAVADGRDPDKTYIGDISSPDVISLPSDARVEDAIKLMRDRAVRRLPVIDAGQAVGIVSLGDLAIERDSGSALADISAAPPSE
jgi:CBS domain-containing protein